MAKELRNYILTATFGMDHIWHTCLAIPDEVEDPKLLVDDEGRMHCTGCGKKGQALVPHQEPKKMPALKRLDATYRNRHISHTCAGGDPTAELKISPTGFMACTGCDMMGQL